MNRSKTRMSALAISFQYCTRVSRLNDFKIARYKICIQKSVVFLYACKEQSKKELKIIVLFIMAHKRIKLFRNKFSNTNIA